MAFGHRPLDPKLTALSPRQRETLKFIEKWLEARGNAPTIQEIADHFGISKTGAFDRVRMLMKKGVLAYRRYGSRSLQLEETPARELARLVLERYASDRDVRCLAEKILAST